MKWLTSQLKTCLSSMLCLCLAAPAWGYIPQREDIKSEKGTVPYRSFVTQSENGTELDLTTVSYFHTVLRKEKIDTTKYIPTNIPASNDQQQVFVRILEHSVETVIDDYNWDDSIGTVAKAINDGIKTSVTVSEEDSKIKHKFNMNMNAAQALAQLSYSGYITANLNYQIGSNAMDVQVNKAVGAKTIVYYNHRDSQLGTEDHVGLRWVW